MCKNVVFAQELEAQKLMSQCVKLTLDGVMQAKQQNIKLIQI